MKKWFTWLILMVLMFGCTLNIYAAHGKVKLRFGNSHEKPKHQIREDARYIIHRTAMTLFEARRAVQRRHHYSGLARAVAHQQKARELYMDGSYREAIFHSLRSREIAIRIIRENRGRIRPEFNRDEMEERYRHDSPRDDDLDFRLDRGKIGRDDDAVQFEIKLDL